MIVDESLSVKVPNYVRMKTFLTQFIYQFDPDTHFSIITFAGKANVRCKFSDKRCQTADGTYDLISEIPDKLFYGTYTDKALIAANEIVFTPENGDRADVKNVVIVITDGKTMKGAAPFNVTVPPLRVCLTTREIKIHVYRKRQTSDSSREFLWIENKQVKTIPNDSYG